MSRLIRVVSCVLVGVVSLAGGPSAQEPAAPQAPAAPQSPGSIFRSGIDSVSVDVIVTDKQGRPVTDLTVADFEVREEGKPQKVETFKLIQVDDGQEDPGAQRDILSASEHTRELASEENRLLIIFLDDYHTRLGNSFVIRERLAQFVSELAPRDLVALTTPLRPASALTFSRNHAATAGQIMSFTGRKYDYRPVHPIEFQYQFEPPQVQERMRNSWTIASLRALCEYVGSFRVGRKTVLYVSEGMTNTFPDGVMTMGTGNMPRSPLTPMVDPDPTDPRTRQMASQQLIQSMELVNDLQDRIFKVAAKTNTSIYTLDPRGLASFEYSVADTVAMSVDKLILNQTTDVLRTIADNTDGRAMVNRNDPMPALKQMIRDGSAYYLLGYNSSGSFRDGQFHEIQVRVKRRDVDVRARKGYWAISPDEVARVTSAAKPPVPEAVSSALGALAETATSARRRPVTLWLGAAKGPADKALVTFVWEASTMDAEVPSERVDRLSITANSVQGETLFAGPVDRDPQATAPAGQVSFEAPAGAVRVRVETTNAAGRRLESSEVSLDIPDFSATSAQITTPFVFRGRTARDLQQLRAMAAPLPTTQRAFSRTERLLLRFGAYGPGGTAPVLTMRVLNKQGSAIATMPAPSRTEGQTFESEFGLGSFPPGEYVIEIAAVVNGETTKKLVAIRVTG